jgi:hypothetical protein
MRIATGFAKQVRGVPNVPVVLIVEEKLTIGTFGTAGTIGTLSFGG